MGTAPLLRDDVRIEPRWSLTLTAHMSVLALIVVLLFCVDLIDLMCLGIKSINLFTIMTH